MKPSVFSHIRVGLMVGTCLGALTVMTHTAPAQDRGDRGIQGLRGDGDRGDRGNMRNRRGGRGMGFATMMRPEFVRRDIQLISESLELDRTQQQLVETFILDYETSFEEAAEAMRDDFRSLRPERELDPATEAKRDEIRNRMRELLPELRDMRERIRNDEDYDEAEMEALQEKFRSMREEMRELRPPRPEGEELDALQEAYRAVADSWQAERNALRSEFLGNVSALLSEQQMELWPGFEQRLRRQQSLPQGRLSGERVNLFQIVRSIPELADNDDRLEPVLDAYAMNLDRTLMARDEIATSAMMDVMQFMQSGETEEALKIAEEVSARRVAVRNVNARYARELEGVIAAEFSPELAARFEEQYRRRAYSRIAGPTRIDRAFRELAEMEELDPETRATVSALQANYDSQMASLTERLITMTRDYEPERDLQRLRIWAARMNGEQADWPDNPLQIGRASCRERVSFTV